MKSGLTVRSPTLNDSDASCTPHQIRRYKMRVGGNLTLKRAMVVSMNNTTSPK